MRTIPAKTLLSARKDTSWFGTEYNMNIYKVCCHGCIYCDSRSDCYQITEFDTIRAKENALAILGSELRHRSKTGVVGTGSMSDPYNPYEKNYELTRQALMLIHENHFGVAIATKSSLITRDIDILKKIKEHSPVICKITITAYEDEISRMLEPGVSVSSERFEAVRRLSEAGIFSGILMMPLLPYLTDTPENVLSIVRQAKESGARFIYPLFGLTLRNGQREYFYQKLEELFPGQKLMERYIQRYGLSYQCHSPRENELKSLFTHECNRLGLLNRMDEIIRAYRSDYEYEQIKFPFV